ncbi:hypothetical protein GVX82_01470 [Patescibacteria group bacterium]|jgi:type IV pilus assembly protein PilC|nr:hypothetical protein [Patescibacteria group bacterium]
MLFHYKVIDSSGHELEGDIEAANKDVAISSLQSRGFVITKITSEEDKSVLQMDLSSFRGIPARDVVIMSRQIATLFEAQVSALRIFRLLGQEVENKALQQVMVEIADDLQGGASISRAMSKHPKAFSDFYVNMVRSGEETGKLDETFLYLADYLDRQYQITSKVKGALIYPAFVIFVFVAVMYLMLAYVIPSLSTILEDSGADIPFYTQITLSLSSFAQNYGLILFALIGLGGFFFWRYYQSEQGRYAVDSFRISAPVIGDLFRKLYLSRIADNVSTMLGSGISMVRTLEITGTVVGNAVYEDIIEQSIAEVRNGSSVSAAFGKHDEMPGILVQMIKVGEETGELGAILKTLSKFYQREVEQAIDTMIGLIEPIMIIVLGVGVGGLLASVIVPIYSVTMSIQ